MRFGMWAAAAAAMVLGAGQASAARFISYTVTGSGTEAAFDVNYNPLGTFRPVGFAITFSFEIDPGSGASNGYVYTTTNSSFMATSGPNNFNVAVTPSTLNANQVIGGRVDSPSSLSLAFANNGAFPTNGYYSVSGSAALQSNTNYTSDYINGSIDKLIVGRASGIRDFSVVVYALPEPATWAMMIFGIGAIGGALRRRRSVLVPA